MIAVPVQNIIAEWLFASSRDFGEAERTVKFSSQAVFAQTCISHINWGTETVPSTFNVNAQIKSYTKANGTVVDLSTDPKNNAFSESDVVSVTFILQVINAEVWSSAIVYLFG
jgi:hypothetical protein